MSADPATVERELLEAAEILDGHLDDTNGGPPDHEAREAAERVVALLNRLEPLDPDKITEHGELRERADLTIRQAAGSHAYLGTANDLAEIPTGRQIGAVIERGSGDDAEYDLHLEDGQKITGVPLHRLYDPRRMAPLLEQHTRAAVPWHTPKEWKPFATAIVRSATPDRATGDRQDEAREWLASFAEDPTGAGGTLPAYDLDSETDLRRALVEDAPIFSGADRRLYVRPSKLLRYVNITFGQRTTSQDLRRRLGRLGFEPPRNDEGKLAIRLDADRTCSRRYLASPPGWEP